jgi:hypothetical protein
MKIMTWRIVSISILAGTAAVAQSSKTARSSCPEGYWQLGSLCLNNSTGDVVDAAPLTER